LQQRRIIKSWLPRHFHLAVDVSRKEKRQYRMEDFEDAAYVRQVHHEPEKQYEDKNCG
jgi:hypothetical protein